MPRPSPVRPGPLKERLIGLASLAANRLAERLYKHLVRLLKKPRLRRWATRLARSSRVTAYGYALVCQGAGLLGQAREVLRGLRFRKAKHRLLAERIEQAVRILDRGWPPIPSPPDIRPSFNGRVVMALHFSLPHHLSGYTIRSQMVLGHLQKHGIQVTAATRLNYPWQPRDRSSNSHKAQNEVEGVTYRHLQEGQEFFGLSPDPVYAKAYGRKLAEVADRTRAGVIHAASNYINGLAAAQAGQKTGARTIYEVRGLWHLTYAARAPYWDQSDLFKYYQEAELAAMEQCQVLVTISQALRQEMIGWGIPAEKIHLIPSGVDLDLFPGPRRSGSLKKKLGLAGKFVIGFIGSLTAYEGLELLIEAVGRLGSEKADVGLVIVGDGHARSGLERLARRRLKPGQAIFTGQVPFGSVREYYSIIDLCPFPRRSYPICRLVPPLKPLEAMALGIPVIVSDLDPLLEMVTDGRSGLVCQVDDPGSLKEKIQTIYENPELGRALAGEARKWVEKNRSWPKLAGRYLEVYF